MIVDISLNEITINYIESSCVQFAIFYPKVEKIILDECVNFYDKLKTLLTPAGFEEISLLHVNELKSVFPKSTQRKLQE